MQAQAKRKVSSNIGQREELPPYEAASLRSDYWAIKGRYAPKVTTAWPAMPEIGELFRRSKLSAVAFFRIVGPAP